MDIYLPEIDVLSNLLYAHKRVGRPPKLKAIENTTQKSEQKKDKKSTTQDKAVTSVARMTKKSLIQEITDLNKQLQIAKQTSLRGILPQTTPLESQNKQLAPSHPIQLSRLYQNL